MSKPYHKYIFDQEKRAFVGKFDEMYRQEDIEKFDSWDQENTAVLTRQLILAVINRYDFKSVLDFGCGKGYFTNLLLRKNNNVYGMDVSEYAISKAKSLFPQIHFSVSNDQQFMLDYKTEHDLILTIEVLSYIEDWKRFIKSISSKTKWYLLTLYLPDNPIGFIKSFDELRKEVERYFDIETDLLINKEQVLFFARRR